MKRDDPIIQPVILAGGSGTRLWPASRQSHPKQLLVLTGSQTMLQQTALRLQGFTHARLAARPLLVTNEDYRFIVADQLSQIGISDPRIVLEPVGRNTAPALTVAALLSANDSDPILLVMPSDHLIADLAAFHRTLAEGAEQAAAGAIVAFGVPPLTPETGYGYIRTGDALHAARYRAGIGDVRREARRGDRAEVSVRGRLPLEQRHVHGQVVGLAGRHRAVPGGHRRRVPGGGRRSTDRRDLHPAG